MQELQTILQGIAIDCSVKSWKIRLKILSLFIKRLNPNYKLNLTIKKIYLLGKDASSEMQNILSSISPEVLVKKLFLEKLKQNQFKLLSEIDLQISILKSSQEELKEAQEALHHRIFERLKKMKKYLSFT